MIKKIIKLFYYSLVRYFPARGVVVLMYHSVGDNSEFFTVSAADFEKQMAYLAENNYHVLSVSKAIELFEGGRELPPKTVIITFDDGYKDNYDYVFPVLKKYGFSAAIFIVTGSVGGARTTTKGTALPTLNWQQIKEMADSGLVEFFPHSHTHPKLDLISDEDIRYEVQTSKNILEKELGKKMTNFAYPYGRSNQKVRDILDQEYFRSAFTVKTGRISSKTNLMLLNRNSIDSKVTPAMFKGIVHYGRI